MPLNAHDASVGVFVRGLTSLKVLLTAGEGHVAATGSHPDALLRAKLASDMYDLGAQMHWAAEGARMAVDRLIGAPVLPPVAAGDAGSFAELHQRLDAALTYLGTVDGDALETGLARTIAIPHRGGSLRYTGSAFLLQFAVPSFFFHLTSAYAILRNNGVPLTKGDFLGPLGETVDRAPAGGAAPTR